tara:strand:- start:410 stop:613 length:204 start_codon:yes stop_codon:yes gene_type:complete
MKKANNELKKLNKYLQKILTKDRFLDRIEELVKEGTVKIVDCEDDGTPIINITKKGIRLYMNELGDA